MLQPDAKERFMECKVAYQTLSDSKERKRFDRNGVRHSSNLAFAFHTQCFQSAWHAWYPAMHRACSMSHRW